MSQTCQQRTQASHQIASLFKHLVSASSAGGMMMPSCLAVLKLITSRTCRLFDRQVGGFAPLKILSTKAADRRNPSQINLYVRSKPVSAYSLAAAIAGSRSLTAMTPICPRQLKSTPSLSTTSTRARSSPSSRTLVRGVQPAFRPGQGSPSAGQPRIETAGRDWAQSWIPQNAHTRGSAVRPSPTDA
jgi:hypothetical protein